MRIAFFLEIFYPEINGVITATLDLTKNLQARGHHVLLVVPENKAVDPVHEIDGIEVYRVPSISAYLYPGVRYTNPWDRGLLRKLREDRIEILHITGPWTLAWSAINHARRLGIPLAHTFHTMLNEDTYLLYLVKFRGLIPLGRFITWWYLGKFIRASDLITTPSGFACEELRKRYPDRRIRHISNGIDLVQFRSFASPEEFRETYPFFNDKIFVFVGRIGLEKSIDTLIEAFAEAARQDPGIRLVMVGDGPTRPAMEKLAENLGIDERVRFLGRVPHGYLLRSGILHYALAFVTASVTENQPMTVIEAVCCGLPIIAADVEGMRELSAGNALIFAPGDRAGLAGCMVRIAGDPELRKELGEKSRAFGERFDGRKVAASFEEEYRTLIG